MKLPRALSRRFWTPKNADRLNELAQGSGLPSARPAPGVPSRDVARRDVAGQAGPDPVRSGPATSSRGDRRRGAAGVDRTGGCTAPRSGPVPGEERHAEREELELLLLLGRRDRVGGGAVLAVRLSPRSGLGAPAADHAPVGPHPSAGCGPGAPPEGGLRETTPGLSPGATASYPAVASPRGTQPLADN